LAFQIKKRPTPTQVQSEFMRFGDDKILGSTAWLNDDGSRVERFQVLTIRDGKIADMEGFTSRREAERFARRR
jgi:hypothetical protein